MLELWTTVAPYVLPAVGVALAGSALALAVAFVTALIGRTLPARVSQVAEEALDAGTRALGEANQLRAEWNAEREQLENIIEQLERRAKRQESAAARLERAERGDQEAQNGAIQLDPLTEARRRLGVGGHFR